MIVAYIDPSSMTYLIQIIAGVAIAAVAGIGFYWKRIKRHFRSKRDAKLENEAAASGPVPDMGEGETITADMLRAQAASEQDADHKA